MDSGLVDEIGNTVGDPLKVSTRGNELANYKLVESGADTGIFIGEVTLTGFQHDADGDGTNDISGTAKALTSTQSISAQKGPTEWYIRYIRYIRYRWNQWYRRYQWNRWLNCFVSGC
jgi:hypothetical protein